MAKKPPSSDIAFTAAVKAEQTRRGSRAAYQKMESRGGWETEVSEGLAEWLAARDSFYLATANARGQPYVQHRGGPKGFLKVLDPHTLAFADYSGNRQYISLGNLAENDQAFLFVMNYRDQQRVKLWGRARVVEGDAALLARVATEGGAGRPERVILFDLEAWDGNCPQHIPVKLDADEVQGLVDALRTRVTALEAENERLRQQLGGARPAGAHAR